MAQGHILKRTHKRADGTTTTRYQARLPVNGRRVIKTFSKRGDAQRWLNSQQASLTRGDYIDPTRASTTFASLAEQWTATRAANHAPRTQERNASILRTYLLPEWGSTPLNRLDRPAIKAWFSTHPFPSPATAKKVHSVLSSILSEGVEMGLLRTNPAARLKLPPAPARQMQVLTAQEVSALAQAAGQQGRPQDRLAVLTAAYTGLRAGELWALQAQDVVLDPSPTNGTAPQPRLLVRRTLTSVSGQLVFRPTTKTGRPRTVSLPAFLAAELAAHLRSHQPEALVFTAPGGGGGRTTGHGGPVRHELWMRRVFRPAVKACLPHMQPPPRFHDLRHTCASLLIAQGASIMLVAARLGHASTRMTLDRYSWMYPSEEAAMAVALDAVWQGQDEQAPEAPPA